MWQFYHGVLGRVALCSDRRRDPCRHPQDQGPVGRGAGPAARPHLYRVLPFYGAGVHHPRRPAQPELPLQDLSCDGRQRHRHGIVQESLRFTHPRLKKGHDNMNAHITGNNTPRHPPPPTIAPHCCAGTGPRQSAAECSRQAGAAHRQRQRGAVGDRWPDHRCRHLGMVGEQQLYSRGHPRR